MAAYRFLAADAMTRTVREEIPFTSVRFAIALNGAGSFSASLPIDHPKASRGVLDPARTIIYVERNGQIVGGWWLWTAKTSGQSVQFDGAELWSYFRRRYLRFTQKFENVDTAIIAGWIMGVTAVEAGSWTAHQSTIEPTGVPLTITYFSYERKKVGDIVEGLAKLSASSGGFDFGIESAWSGNEIVDTFRVWQRRGRPIEVTFEDGSTAEDVAWTVDGTAVANRVEVFGSGQKEGAEVGTVTAADLIGTYPLLESVESNNDTNDVAVLSGLASSLLQARRLPPELMDVTAGKHEAVDFGSYWVGDTVRMRADRGYLQCEMDHRVTSIDVTVDASGDETVQPSFAVDESAG